MLAQFTNRAVSWANLMKLLAIFYSHNFQLSTHLNISSIISNMLMRKKTLNFGSCRTRISNIVRPEETNLKSQEKFSIIENFNKKPLQLFAKMRAITCTYATKSDAAFSLTHSLLYLNEWPIDLALAAKSCAHSLVCGCFICPRRLTFRSASFGFSRACVYIFSSMICCSKCALSADNESR